MSLIQGIGPSQALTTLYHLTGQLPLNLDTTVVPVVNVGEVNDLVRYGPPAWGSLDLAAVAGPNNNVIELALPIANDQEGLAAYIEWIMVTSSVVNVINIFPSPGLAAPTHHGVRAWRNTASLGLPQLLIEGKNNAAPVGTRGPIRFFLPANTQMSFNVGWALGRHPNTGLLQGLLIEPETLNSTLLVNVAWREGAPR